MPSLYSITIRKQAMKALEDINEPYYSNIKTAIYTNYIYKIVRLFYLILNPSPQEKEAIGLFYKYNWYYSLAKNPRPSGYKKLKGRDAYRIRVSDYRIIYEIFEKILLVDVIDLGHRKEIYK